MCHSKSHSSNTMSSRFCWKRLSGAMFDVVCKILFNHREKRAKFSPITFEPQKFTRYKNDNDMLFRHDWAICMLVRLFRLQWRFTSSTMSFWIVSPWRIRDLTDRGNPTGGHATYHLVTNFPKQLENERNWTKTGRECPWLLLCICQWSCICFDDSNKKYCWFVWPNHRGYKWWFFFFSYGDLFTIQRILWRRVRCNNCSHVNDISWERNTHS